MSTMAQCRLLVVLGMSFVEVNIPPHTITLRATFREPIAEFIAVALFVFFGCAADCSVVLSANPVVSATPKGVRIAQKI